MTAIETAEVRQAGAIAFRKAKEGPLEILLVRPGNARLEWLFPKGHIEQDENEVETALRELQEDLRQTLLAHQSEGSEANAVVTRFTRLPEREQQDLLNFLRTL